MDKGKKDVPLPPPYNLSAADPSQLRNEADQQANWSAYEEMVSYAAAHLTVVTSQDILELAKQ